jgi:hypothetical protein
LGQESAFTLWLPGGLLPGEEDAALVARRDLPQEATATQA